MGMFPHTLGPYTLQKLLGRGGSAEVWAATREGCRGDAALKITRNQGSGATMLYNEAQVCLKLTHPNLVHAWEAQWSGDWVWMAMPLVEGTTVAELLNGWGHLPPRAVLQIGVQLCAALEHLHRMNVGGHQGLVHRDVTPRNILIGGDGRVRLIDLGLVCSARPHEAPRMAGTPGFMAPEQSRGLMVDGRADLYSVGAVLVTMLLGRVRTRWMRETGIDGMWRRMRILQLSTNTVLPGLGAIITSCLQPDADHRPPSAAALGRALMSLSSDSADLLTVARRPLPMPLEGRQHLDSLILHTVTSAA